MTNTLITVSKAFKIKALILLMGFIVTSTSSCSKEGCTDPTATNYDKEADTDNGTCISKQDVILLRSYTVYGNKNCQTNGYDQFAEETLTIFKDHSSNKTTLFWREFALTCTESGSSLIIGNQFSSPYNITGSLTFIGNAIIATINAEYSYFGSSENCIHTINGNLR